MRRIALTAALVATLAGGAAALAATPDAGTPDAAPPDPYQGAWALTIDGRFAGSIQQVQGCGLAASIVSEQDGGEHLASPAPEACTFEAGAGLSPDFYNLVDDGLAGVSRTHEIELVRVDAGAPHYGLRISHALLGSVTLPKVDRASTAPVFLQIGVAGDHIARDDAPKLGGKALPARGFDPAQLRVSLGGQDDLGVAAAGPWSAEIKTSADQVGQAREAQLVPVTADVGNLPLRVPESSKAMSRVIEPWVKSALVDGGDAEKPVKLTVGGLSLTFDRAAPERADLVARADGARTYSLYAEHAVIAAG